MRQKKEDPIKKGRRIEREFEKDLRLLKKARKIKKSRMAGWHSQLDFDGIDAIVTKNDGQKVPINVTTTNPRTIQRHYDVNRRHRRKPILIWPHNEKKSRWRRALDLLKRINKFKRKSTK